MGWRIVDRRIGRAGGIRQRTERQRQWDHQYGEDCWEVDIGSWEGQASHTISIRLSPLHIKVAGDPKTTLESFWQTRKCLAVWVEGEEGARGN